ncbi:MAG: magnesium transporter [Candidatus Eisenbacteria bacterium]|uniref:Magnesium transporter MgtE n=1 Tax=Eiseniibacteriota bacterium TaxID=2212470 RepID=A0A7Y2E714_UNCEI|nr:magnesium transporter [Candidatus Eisenbacteria bacterium]
MDPISQPLIEDIKDDLMPLIKERRAGALLAVLLDLHPADIAELMAITGDEDDQAYIFGLLNEPELASAVLAELSTQVREPLVEDIPRAALADLVEEMSSDDAADLIQELPTERVQQVLDEIEEEELEAVQPLLAYDEETAGGIMATEVLAIGEGATVGDALELVRTKGEEYDPFFYVYVQDSHGRLQGILSLKNLVMHGPETSVLDACNREPVSVPVTMDQEEVALIFRRYDLLAVPVIDDKQRILGRITIDDVVDVMREEADEDIARMAGTDEEEFDETSIRKIVFYRLPWILASVAGGFLAGVLLDYFAMNMALGISLVAFVPMIMAMGGNAGSQAAITMVRLLALRKLNRSEVLGILWREARVGMFLGGITGLSMGVIAYFWKGAWYYGVVVGASMAMAVLVAASMGAMTPILFKKLKVDPAIATGPFVTVSNDATGLLIYFGLAIFLLRFFSGAN